MHENIRPKVSVCMATYNGGKFINDQIVSILSVLSKDDELIICDDNSNDNTLNVIKSFKDERLKLQYYKNNIGYVGNFERALSLASGEIVFLSDQDDIWHIDKYKVVLDYFIQNPRLVALSHSLFKFEENNSMEGLVINGKKEGAQKSLNFLSKQFISPDIFGCGLIFRNTLLEYALPFPSAAYSHDHWLSIIAALFGDFHYLKTPLVYYRQHDNNLTPKRGFNITRIIRVRGLWIIMLIIAAKRIYFSRYKN